MGAPGRGAREAGRGCGVVRPEGEPGGPTADPVLARGRRPGCRSTGPESGGRLGPRRHHCDRATLSGPSCPRCPVCKRRASAAQGSPVRTERLGCLQPLEQTGAASALTAVTVVSRGPREHRHAEPCASWGPDPRVKTPPHSSLTPASRRGGCAVPGPPTPAVLTGGAAGTAGPWGGGGRAQHHRQAQWTGDESGDPGPEGAAAEGGPGASW